MIRFFFRFIGLLLLAAAFILVIYDGTKSIAANNLYFTSVRTLWELLNAGSLAKLQPLIRPYAGGVLWDPGMVALLAAPAWSLLGCFGILFILFGRRKKPLIGYARS
jgi:peptidoglycan/LPS O-acetylase OafA/YrhL